MTPKPLTNDHDTHSRSLAVAASQSLAVRERRSAATGLWAYDQLRLVLDDAMATSLSDIDPVPWAVVEQARRRAVIKGELLHSGAFTVAALAAGWETSVQAARKRIERYRRQRQVFTVKHANELIVPQFLLTVDLEPRAELQPMIAALREVGEDGWSLWAWFTRPSAWLGGEVPADLAERDPDRVTVAATRRAAASAA